MYLRLPGIGSGFLSIGFGRAGNTTPTKAYAFRYNQLWAQLWPALWYWCKYTHNFAFGLDMALYPKRCVRSINLYLIVLIK